MNCPRCDDTGFVPPGESGLVCDCAVGDAFAKEMLWHIRRGARELGGARGGRVGTSGVGEGSELADG